MKIAALVAPGTPAYDAGLEQDDVITGVNGKEIATPQQLQDALRTSKPGDRLTIAYTRRDGPKTTSVTLKGDPNVEIATIESTGGTPTPEQKAFRDRWLGSQQVKR